MEFNRFTAGPDDDERRLDRVARKFLSEESLSHVYKSIRSGLIKVNGKRQDASFHVHEGDTISIADFLVKDSGSMDSGRGEAGAPLEKITVLRTKDLLFLNKPYNICVQGASPNGVSLDSMVKEEYAHSGQSHEKSLSFTPGPLHRLDRQTTGLAVFSQSIDGARWFSRALREHALIKKYIAIAEGSLNKEETWEDSISNSDKNMYKKADRRAFFHTVSARDAHYGGQYARTKASPLAHGSLNGRPVTLVEYTLFTGRKHQIRASSARHGFPLLGDSAYGAARIGGNRRLFLHSCSISFPENSLGLPGKISCPPGDDFISILRASLINWNYGL